ncbi:hypothetical protein [Nocardioides sp. HDW12B]|uniref:hypothetical protein n=1 Tax=Nocardioides sp. HDW12B TaxID=2714939 RepID=UPI00197F0740|nr:hypothetical protein [Nocardioides sp. HDW12B]
MASDVLTRDGIGWEFTTLRQEDVWAVFREDGGAFPVFSAARGEGALPPPDALEAMTREAVADLLAAADLADGDGWIMKNISAALLLASLDVLAWEGEEWALESGDDDVALAWAMPADGRTPFAWLRARGSDRDFLISIYQDDAVFGLSFVSNVDLQLPGTDHGSLRSRRDVPLVVGGIKKVEVVLDTLVEGGSAPGLVTEVLLHGDASTSLLIAAESYSHNEWHLYDESVVVLPDVAAADALDWIPPRRNWRPTEVPGR